MNLAIGHPTSGTCNDASCEFYGVCHDDCGRTTRIACQNRSQGSHYGQWTKGQPMIWVNGRHRIGNDYWVFRTGSGSYVERDKLAPLIDFLVGRYGTLKATADAIGVPLGTLTSLRYQKSRKAAYAGTAQAIIAAVLACKTPTDPWTEFDPRRPPTEWERVKSRRYQVAEEQRSNRAKRAKRQEAS